MSDRRTPALSLSYARGSSFDHLRVPLCSPDLP